MLEKIETKEIMTTREALKKYPTKYFLMVITEVVDQADNDLGYVIYTADEDRELTKNLLDEYNGLRVAFKIGGLAEPFPSYGGLEVVRYG